MIWTPYNELTAVNAEEMKNSETLNTVKMNIT